MSKKHRIVINVSEGVVEAIASDTRNVEIYVCDYDDLERLDVTALPDAIASPREDVDFGTRAVDRLQREWNEAVLAEQKARESQ